VQDVWRGREGNFTNILGIIVVTIITMLIPLAIALWSDQDKSFDTLDRNVLLDHIINARFFPFYLALVFLSLFFWSALPVTLRFLGVVIWGFGTYRLFFILILRNANGDMGGMSQYLRQS
jgi:hypothetical protein